MGWARGMQASVALWDGRFEDAAGYAADGLSYLGTGAGGARLHMLRARANAILGRAAVAKQALAMADDARAVGGDDELHDVVAGEFAFRPAKHIYYAAVTHLYLGDAPMAIEKARESLRLYETDARAHRSYGCESMARAHLAVAYLREDDPRGAEEAMAPLLALPPERRIDSLTATLAASRELLPGRLQDQIEGFCSTGLPQRAIAEGAA
jgi:hypothetical protein